jgi:hypothetical protein
MAIDVTAVGGSGSHSLARVNVNTEEEFIYYKNTAGDTIPAALVPGTTFIYASGAGSIGGLSDGDLVYVTTTNVKKLQFSFTSDGAPVDLTGSIAGGVSFNAPVVYQNKLNIDASTPTNQAVKYYTNGTPMTGLVSGNTYFLKNVSISEFAGTQALYQFTSHTFTTGGQTGRVGPTIAQLRSAYTVLGNWDDVYLQQGEHQGYQDWTVPVSGIYELDVRGAAGGTDTGSGAVGRGARLRGRVALTKGEVITIVVGQRGESSINTGVSGGGGGASFVVRKSSGEPLFIAGGGAGQANSTAGRDAVLTTLGGPSTGVTAPPGTAGNGGTAAGGASAGGGGFFSRGGDAFLRSGFSTIQNAVGGGSFFSGLSHTTIARNGGAGGFGGGGMADGNFGNQSGGGGGYSGGGGARTGTANHSGGGGGCFITPTATNIATSTGLFDGASTYEGQSITNLNSFNTDTGSIGVTLVTSFTTGNEVYPTALDAENGTNKIGVEAAGSSYHSFVPISFDIQNNAIHSPTPHTLTNGSAVAFTFNSTPPAGLGSDLVYYVNTIDTFSYGLSSTPGPDFATVDFTVPSRRSTSGSDQIRRVVVNTSVDTLTINNHGFQVNQPILYDSGEDGTPIVPLQNNTTYYVSEVLDANRIRLKTALNSPSSISFTAAGTGTQHSFIFVTVNLIENTLYIPNHGLVSGQAVRYNRNGNDPIGGLVDGTTYFVDKVDNSIIRLASNRALTQIVNLSSVGVGTQSLVITSLDFANDAITVPSHGFLQGELVEYDSRGQQAVAGLTTATPYYVIFIDGDNIKLATTPQNATEGIAIDLQESPAGVGVHSLTSLTKTPDGIYEINGLPSETEFEVEAKGVVPAIEKTFNPRSSLDLNLDVFRLVSHGFLTGTKVRYLAGEEGTAISGLTNNTDYFVVAVNRDYLRLAASAENALSGITLSVADFGTGVNHQFITNQINGNLTGGGTVSVGSGSVLVNGIGTSFAKILKVGDRFRLYPPNQTSITTFAAANVNTISNRLTSITHTFETGDTVVFTAEGGVAPSPLIDGYYYFVRAVSETELTLHGSFEDAVANTSAVDFSTTGTGTNFRLARTTPVSPIIRKITAVGSDTQITVDRPYANSYSNVSYAFPTFIYVRPQGYSLHRPFDGGVEMSAGAGTSLAQIIRQTRKYFRYQSGKGIQTSAGINFKPSIDIESMTRFSDVQIECKTRRPHGLLSGLFIEVSQATDSQGNESEIYNGEFQVTVVDLTTFRVSSSVPVPEGVESRAFGFPQFYVRNWENGAVRSGMFDFQNGAFFEYDGQKLFCVRRSSTQQLAGTASALQGSELVFGTNTKFTAQLTDGDYIVLRGQSYRVVKIESDTRLAIRPEYKGSSGTEKEFDPGNGVDGAVRLSNNRFQLTSHGFSDKLPVTYNSIDGEPIGGLINGRTYYVKLIDNNSFQLTASPDSDVTVNLSSVGTTAVHSFVPAKSGIVITKTVDTRVPQEEFSVDPLDGTGPTGYNLDLSRIQMAYIDYSWYGAGKIRFGFKTGSGQVQYVHEFIHNNLLYESYFRSGNLPGRYEVVTYDNPTYIPYLFHWGTSVMMDGRFDDDNAYLFTANSQTLQVRGTTEKSFAPDAINVTTDAIEIPSHGFSTGNPLQFEGISTSGLRGDNAQNPSIRVLTGQTASVTTRLANVGLYYAHVKDANNIGLYPPISGPGLISAGTGQTVTNVAVTSGIAALTMAGTTFNVLKDQIIHLTGLGIQGVPDGFYPIETASTGGTSLSVNLTSRIGTTNISSVAGTGRVDVAVDFLTQGNSQYTYFLYPEGALNNTSGPNYQPLLSLRLSPSVSEGLTGKLGDRDVINRMQLRLQEIGVSTNALVDVKILLNPRLNNLNFQSVDPPSLTQIVEHTAADTVSGGIQVYNFSAQGGAGGVESTTTVDVSTLFELSNSILGGDSIFPDGPDILTIAVSRLTGTPTLSSAKMSWAEAQA